MFVVQISFFIVTFLFLISQNLSLMQIIKEVNPRPHIVPCVNMWKTPKTRAHSHTNNGIYSNCPNHFLKLSQLLEQSIPSVTMICKRVYPKIFRKTRQESHSSSAKRSWYVFAKFCFEHGYTKLKNHVRKVMCMDVVSILIQQFYFIITPKIKLLVLKLVLEKQPKTSKE